MYVLQLHVVIGSLELELGWNWADFSEGRSWLKKKNSKASRVCVTGVASLAEGSSELLEDGGGSLRIRPVF